MYNFKEVDVAPFLFTVIISPLLCFIAWKKLTNWFTWFFRWIVIRLEEGKTSSHQDDIIIIKKTSLQIADDWMEMMKLIKGIQDSQGDFVDRLENHIESISEKFGRDITVSLEEEFLRNDQRFGKLRRSMEAMQENILSMKNFLQTFHQRALKSSENSEKGEKMICIDNFAQTEYDIKKKIKDRPTKFGIETETSKLTNIVKKCLADLVKDAKLHVSIEQEEENRELQVVLSKLSEDREDIKKTIIQAFSIAAEQAKRNFDQFGDIGQDAMNYIAVLNEKTNKMLQMKLEESDNRLKEILSTVDRQNFEIDAIGETLEKIDGQFDVIFQRVELGCQRNTEHLEELAQSLDKTASTWVVTAAELEKATINLSNDTNQVKEMLKELTISFDCLKPADKENAEKSEVTQYDSVTSETAQDLRMLSQKQKNMMLIFSMIQSCRENMTCMNNRVEKGCKSLCNLIEGLEYKLISLNESVGRLDQAIRSVNLENLFSAIKCQDTDSEEMMENVLNMGNAGDGQHQMALMTETLDQKVRWVMHKEVIVIERILMKFCEKLNLLRKEIPCNSANTVNRTEESLCLEQ